MITELEQRISTLSKIQEAERHYPYHRYPPQPCISRGWGAGWHCFLSGSRCYFPQPLLLCLPPLLLKPLPPTPTPHRRSSCCFWSCSGHHPRKSVWNRAKTNAPFSSTLFHAEPWVAVSDSKGGEDRGTYGLLHTPCIWAQQNSMPGQSSRPNPSRSNLNLTSAMQGSFEAPWRSFLICSITISAFCTTTGCSSQYSRNQRFNSEACL